MADDGLNTDHGETLNEDVELGGMSVDENETVIAEDVDFHEIDFGSLNEEEVKNFRFFNNEVAYEFYRKYGMKKGFGVRKNHIRRDKKGEILWQSFVCDREGFREKNNSLVRKRAARKDTRCGCEAKFRVHVDNEKGGWYVKCFKDEHSHELVGEHFGGMIASNRRMTETDIAHMNTMRELGMSTGKIYGSYAGQCGGYPYIGFSKKDMYNQIQKQRRLGNGDAEGAFKYLDEQSKSDRAMYWKHTLDEEGKLQHLFWADGCSIYDYSLFGDVLAFDATYGRNKYKFPVVVFSGVNHHKQTTVFGAAVVSDETEQTYVWLLQQFLEAMDRKQPKCVITDGDLSMKNAIRRIFPDADHRLCAWHICNNAGKHIKKKDFHQEFQRIMYADVEVEDFSVMWDKLVNKHGLTNNGWASKIYDCRHMWARSHIRGKFYAGMHTTSRCEGLHSQIGRYVESGYNVTEFLHHFQRCLSNIRNNEVGEDFNSSYGVEVLQTPYKDLEMNAEKIYTRAVFKEFRQGLLEAAKLRFIGTNNTSSHVIYKVGKHYNPTKKWHVCYHAAGLEFKCSCRRMESFGIACSHILFVMVNLDIAVLPKCVVLDRWTKKAKEVPPLKFKECELSKESVNSSRYGALYDGCRVLCNLACTTEEDFSEMLEKIYNECSRLRTKHNCSGSETGNNVKAGRVKDPVRVRTKGRLACSASSGTKVKRRNQCCICRGRGHNRQSCPNLHPTDYVSDFEEEMHTFEEEDNTGEDDADMGSQDEENTL